MPTKTELTKAGLTKTGPTKTGPTKTGLTKAGSAANAIFFDTTILLYAVDAGDRRNAVAAGLMAQGGTISVQVLNEFAWVARRKFGWAWSDITTALALLRRLCSPPRAIEAETHDRALVIAAGGGFSFYDSLLLASALQADCARFASEDMQDGRIVDGRLTIWNPFR